jgi:hypothetical protein
VLPLASSLVLHVTLIVLGILLYQTVQQANRPNREQSIVPQMSSIQPSVIPAFAYRGPGIDRLRPAAQSIDSVTPPTGFDDRPANNFPSGGNLGNDFPAAAGAGPGGASGAPGQPFGNGSTGLAPWGPPGGGIPEIKGFIPEHARKVVFLCDCSGSMLGVFGRLKQELKQQIAGLDVADGQQFNVIFFSDDAPRALFADGMHLATALEKKLAEDFIDNTVAAGGTIPVPAIQMAMHQKPELIYLLTDGFDQVASFDEVVNSFRANNRNGQTHVDCIFLQSDADPKLEQVLKQIADESHGHFRKIFKSDM